MAKNGEANLLLRIKEQGKEALTKASEALSDIKTQAAIASAAIAGFIGISVKKYGEEEAAVKSLNAALKAQGLNVDELSKKYVDLAAAIQSKTAMDDDAIIKGIAIAQSYAGQIELTEELIRSTIDYAAATGTDLVTAFTAVGKSIGTNTNALARQGIELDKSLTASQKMDKITIKLADSFDGFAEAQRQGLGELKALSNTLDDFLATIGKEFAPIIAKAAKGLNDFFGFLAKNEDVAKFTAAILAVVGALTALVTGLAGLGLAIPAIQTAIASLTVALTAMTGPIGIAVAALGGITTAYLAASGQLDGVISKIKQVVGMGGEPTKIINDSGAEVDERYQRAVHNADRIKELEIKTAREIKLAKIEMAEEEAREKEKITKENLRIGLEAQQDAWDEMKRLKDEADQKEKQAILDAANNPVAAFIDAINNDAATKAQLQAAGISMATGFVSALQQGEAGARQFGAQVAEGIGGWIEGAVSDDALFGLGGFFKELFMFTSQDPELIKAQIKGFVEAIPELWKTLGDSGPAIAEGFIEAVLDSDFIVRLLQSALRSPALEWLGKQWGITSAESFRDTMKNAWDQFLEWIREGFNVIFDGFRGVFDWFLNGLQGFMNWFLDTGIGTAFQKAAEKVGQVLSEWFGQFGLWLSNSVKGIFEQLGNSFNTIFDNLKNAFSTVFTDGVGSIIGAVKSAFDWIGEGIFKVFGGVRDFFEEIGKFLRDPLEPFQRAIESFVDAIKNLGGGIAKGGKSVLEKLGFEKGGIVPGYATGGVVSGPIQRFAAGGTTDTVPAMLTPGEFVINRDAAQKNLGLLQSINAGNGAGSGVTINITVNGGLLGDEASAKQFARAVDQQLLKLRQSNQSVAFDSGIF